VSYEIILILSGLPELTEEAAERLCGAGWTPGACNEVF
jgi:hypothetical protein